MGLHKEDYVASAGNYITKVTAVYFPEKMQKYNKEMQTNSSLQKCVIYIARHRPVRCQFPLYVPLNVLSFLGQQILYFYVNTQKKVEDKYIYFQFYCKPFTVVCCEEVPSFHLIKLDIYVYVSFFF